MVESHQRPRGFSSSTPSFLVWRANGLPACRCVSSHRVPVVRHSPAATPISKWPFPFMARIGNSKNASHFFLGCPVGIRVLWASNRVPSGYCKRTVGTSSSLRQGILTSTQRRSVLGFRRSSAFQGLNQSRTKDRGRTLPSGRQQTFLAGSQTITSIFGV